MFKMLIIGLLFGLAFSQEVGRVEEFSGRVDKLQKGEIKPLPLTKERASLYLGDVVRTKSDGTANLSFIDGNRAKLGPLARLDVVDYVKTRSVNVIRGRVLFEITQLKPGEGFEVRTPTAILGVKGTTFLVDVAPSATLVFVLSGAVNVTPVNNPAVSFTIPAGTGYVVSSTEATRVDLPALQAVPPGLQQELLRPPTPEITPPCVR